MGAHVATHVGIRLLFEAVADAPSVVEALRDSKNCDCVAVSVSESLTYTKSTGPYPRGYATL